MRPEGCAGAGRRVRPESGRGGAVAGHNGAFRALRADGGRIYHNYGAGECNICATISRVAFDRRGSGAWRDPATRTDAARGVTSSP